VDHGAPQEHRRRALLFAARRRATHAEDGCERRLGRHKPGARATWRLPCAPARTRRCPTARRARSPMQAEYRTEVEIPIFRAAIAVPAQPSRCLASSNCSPLSSPRANRSRRSSSAAELAVPPDPGRCTISQTDPSTASARIPIAASIHQPSSPVASQPYIILRTSTSHGAWAAVARRGPLRLFAWVVRQGAAQPSSDTLPGVSIWHARDSMNHDTDSLLAGPPDKIG